MKTAEQMKMFTEKEVRQAFMELQKLKNDLGFHEATLSVALEYRLDTHQNWREENKLSLSIHYKRGGGCGSYVNRGHSLEESLADIKKMLEQHREEQRLRPFEELSAELKSGNLKNNFYRSYLALTQEDKIKLTAVSAKAGVLIPNY